MRKIICFLGLTVALLNSPSPAATNAWFGGGSYDGYDQNSALPPIGWPQVDNAGGATNILAATAWLNGTLLATGGAPTTVYVYWGTNDCGTNKASWGATNSFGVCGEWQALTTNVSVNSNTIYYYRFYATNTDGEGWASASTNFLTPAAPVVNTGVGVSPLSFTTATLNGNLTAGVSANISVYWGQDTNAWSGTNSLGTRSMGAFYTPVAGLNPGELYYYRCYGTNAYGEGWSDTMAFTTRVASVAMFYGGSYDGYDQYSELLKLSVPGTVFYVCQKQLSW
jgi:hypothetical protein